MEIEILEDPQAVALRAARILADDQHTSTSSKYSAALSGGSTPKTLYQILGSKEHSISLPWDNMLWFFGDERCVPSDDAQSNFRMVQEAMFIPAEVERNNVFRVRTELVDPAVIAKDYEEQLVKAIPATADTVPQFDLIYLGMGTDGHTASLFPGTSALQVRDRFVAENFVDKLDAWRITLTVPVLLAARLVVVIVTGEEKAEVLQQVLEGPADENMLPSQCLRVRTGRTIWLTDKEAARYLHR